MVLQGVILLLQLIILIFDYFQLLAFVFDEDLVTNEAILVCFKIFLFIFHQILLAGQGVARRL